VTDDQAIAHVEWRPLAPDDSSLGSVTVERVDGANEDRGHMTRADTARLAFHVFGGSATRIAVGDGIVKWIPRGSE
jgi:hypothetical protein